MKNIEVRRGDIFYADLDPVTGSEQGGVRPVIVLQNNVGNRYSPTVIVAPITSRAKKSGLPTHVPIGGSIPGLSKDSFVLTEQVRTIDRSRLGERVGALSLPDMEAVEEALGISFGLAPGYRY